MPHEITELKELWEAIRALKVRRAPAIGMAASFGLAVWAKKQSTTDLSEFLHQLKIQHDCLASFGPAAVNLFWANRKRSLKG